MTVYIVTLRLIHILAGVFWTGGALIVAGFVLPSVQAAGPAGGAFMQKLAGDRRLPDRLAAAAVVTVLAGLLLYWEASGGLTGEWIGSATGITFTIGGLAGIVAAVVGVGIGAPTTRRVLRLGQEVAAAGGQPGPDQQAAMAALQRRSTLAIRWVAGLAAFATAAMAIAEHVG